MIEVKRLSNGEGLPLPEFKTPGAAGADICSAEDFVLHRGERKLIKTGFAVAIPEGYEIRVRPRSGLALKYGISIVNTPGTVDSDYRGELGVILINTSGLDFFCERGERIAQLVINKVEQMDFVEVDELSDTVRGEGGYGSTGR